MHPRSEIGLVQLVGKLLAYLLVVLGLPVSVGYATTHDIENDLQLILRAQEIPGMIEDKVITKIQIPNPHWRKDACVACHIDNPDAPPAPLKAASDGSCFYCHSKQDHLVTHPVDLKPAQKMLARMPEDFRRKLNQRKETNCITCHDILMQCTRRTTVMRVYNESFVRGGNYKTPTGICYQCHDQAAYQKLNSHEQISEQGIIDKAKCYICHRDIPQQHSAGASTRLTMQTGSDWAEMCLNCHSWRPHPGGNMNFSGGEPPNHMVVPDTKMRERMQRMAAQNDLDMPLEPGSGKIYCATCHNPHQRGVIKKSSLAKGADEVNRLRSEKLCINCHDM